MGELTIEPCRRDREDHARQILTWRNDPVTLSMFFHRAPKESDVFWREYQRDYFIDEALTPFFVVEDGERVAFVRFNRIGGSDAADVSINVAPNLRGRNIGTRTLLLASDVLRARGIRALVAEIRAENRASIRTFEKAGFAFHERTLKHIEDTGEHAAIVVYTKSLA